MVYTGWFSLIKLTWTPFLAASNAQCNKSILGNIIISDCLISSQALLSSTPTHLQRVSGSVQTDAHARLVLHVLNDQPQLMKVAPNGEALAVTKTNITLQGSSYLSIYLKPCSLKGVAKAEAFLTFFFLAHPLSTLNPSPANSLPNTHESY